MEHRILDTGYWHWILDMTLDRILDIYWIGYWIYTGYWILDIGYPDTGYWKLDIDTGYWTLDTRHRTTWTPGAGCETGGWVRVGR